MFLDDAMRAAAQAARERRREVPVSRLRQRAAEAPAVPSFADAIRRAGGGVRLIAEVKKMSPSSGSIKADARAGSIAGRYEGSGASAVSVVTSGFAFGGSLADLAEARSGCRLPLLRKDFIAEEYQVLEARAFGASAVLLIADALSLPRLERLLAYAGDLGIDALVESHSRGALDKTREAGAAIAGINNRDLRTLQVDLRTTERLLPYVPENAILVSESGVRGEEDMARLSGLGIDAVLVGEALMRAERPGETLRALLEAGAGGSRERDDGACG